MKKIYFTFTFLLSFGLSMAQDKGHNPYNDGKSSYSTSKTTGIDPIPTAPPTPPAPIPIDGGVGVLLVAGLGYGVKRMKDRK